MSKTHWKKAMNSPYLGSQDLPDYKDINLTIERVLSTVSKGLKDNGSFNIAYFTDVKVKPMLLNATNCKRVQRLAKSPYVDDWNNIEVTIFVEKGVQAFGASHDALRIRETTTVAQLPVLNEKHAKWLDAAQSVADGTKKPAIIKYWKVSDKDWKMLEAIAKEINKNKPKKDK